MSENRRRKTEDGRKRTGAESLADNQRGMALILALVMLVILSILGTLALSTSSTELFISGNYRNTQTAFYRGDGIVEFDQLREAVYNTGIIEDRTSLAVVWPQAGAGNFVRNGDPDDRNFNNVVVDGATIVGRDKIEWLYCCQMPAGGGTQQDASVGGGSGGGSTAPSFGNYYVVNVVGTGPANSESPIEVMLVRAAASCPDPSNTCK